MPEMRLVGDEDGAVWILCERTGCMVPGECFAKVCFLMIPVPSSATPLDVDRIWMQHKVDHANLEK